ncbi:hypothetical protein [Candidatus Endoriftia persephonae]|jgi:hypothetical protein|uniref:Uncharacterized protein n=2 Tax=Gammaproteobacteria TaxID=1236 RepID=G2FD83_9GAMM|nr:hypothetical protein [Candidatus Endoriftia persephone]EGW55169.1 hypothetical protein TevJSym_ae00260 [endosymbiont of Tevnia jerichonana (vent Tica)]USF88743.1 hypothetical protein L0Y14_05790 [Candidatus Endoriftia persephone]
MGVTVTAVNEGSPAWLTIAFTDRDGQPAAPSSAVYRIDCLSTGTEVQPDTPLSPMGESVELELTSTMNRIIDQTNREEWRLVTVKASFSDGTINDRTEYAVKNLMAV